MNLDELINEAGYSYLNSLIGSGNSGKRSGGLDLFAYENARQERIEKQIEKAREEGNKAKVAELKKKLNSSDIGSGTNVDKDRGTDNVAILKNINKLKGKICFLMMDYANLTSGVGLNGDKSLTNAVKIVKSKKDEDGKQTLKVVGAPSKAELQKHYDMLKKAVEQLKNYEYGYEDEKGHLHGAPRRYFENKQERSKVLLKALENIKPSEISFDPDTIETPFLTDMARVKTGPAIEKDGKKTGDRYAEINPLKTDANGNITSQVWRTKMAKVIGKKRFNAFVYEELQPYIHEFQKYRKDWDSIKHPENISLDFVAKNVKEGLAKREKEAKDITTSGKFSDYKKLRKREQKIEAVTSAKNERTEDGKIDHSMYSSKQGAGLNALRSALYAKEGSKTGNQGWLEAHHIEKMNLTKVKKILNSSIEKGEEPSAKNKKIIKFFGVMPGTAGQGGAGTLIFMHTDKPAPNQFSYEGLYAFKAGKSFMNGDLSLEQEKYVENHAGRKADEWKRGVLEALKKYDVDGQATVYTESVVNYFNY